MADPFTQIYIQLVFAVRYREALIRPEFKTELYKYIGGIFRNQEQKLLAINGMSDHIHIFFSMKPNINLSHFVRDIKSDSSTFINENKLSVLPTFCLSEAMFEFFMLKYQWRMQCSTTRLVALH